MQDNARPRVKMRIEAVRVTGFRALRDVCVTLDPDITVVVGENNTGKSAFLEAIATAMGKRLPVPDDLYIDAEGHQHKEFCIDLLLMPSDGNSFDDQLAPLLGNVIRREGNQEYVAIRTTGSIGEDRSTINRSRCFIEGWTGCDTSHNPEVVVIPGEPVTERHLSPISFTLLEANRDLVDEMRQRSSRWGRLLAQRDLEPGTVDEIENQLKDLGERVLNESQLLTRLRARLDEVQKALPTVNHVELEPLPSRIDDLTRATDILINTPDGPRLPLRMQGLGSRSIAEIMVYTAFAAELSGMEEPYSPHLLTCFEEPEAHLHPQAQLAVIRIIKDLDVQCIITTHSPQITATTDFSHIRLFRHTNSGIGIKSSVGLEMEEENIKARRLIERYSQVFFARLVIIGDGTTEYAALPVFTRTNWDINPESEGVTFVDPGSLGQAGPFIKILDDLGIPWLIFVDADLGGRNALRAIGKRVSRTLTRDSREVVMLPEGMDFEQYLINEGLQDSIKKGITELFGKDALKRFSKIPKYSVLDKDELLIKFLDKNKGTYGDAIAEAIVSVTNDQGKPTIPGLVLELLRRADRILGRSRA